MHELIRTTFIAHYSVCGQNLGDFGVEQKTSNNAVDGKKTILGKDSGCIETSIYWPKQD